MINSSQNLEPGSFSLMKNWNIYSFLSVNGNVFPFNLGDRKCKMEFNGHMKKSALSSFPVGFWRGPFPFLHEFSHLTLFKLRVYLPVYVCLLKSFPNAIKVRSIINNNKNISNKVFGQHFISRFLHFFWRLPFPPTYTHASTGEKK